MSSKYTEEYLNENTRRGGDGKGVTPGTFLSYTLKGRDKKNMLRYQRELERDLYMRVKAFDVLQGHSAKRATAYYWKEGHENLD